MENEILNLSGFEEELGRVLVPTPQQKAMMAKAFADQRAKVAKAMPIVTAAHTPTASGKSKFNSVRHQLPPAEKAAIEQGSRVWDSLTYYKRVQYSGAGGDTIIWDETNTRSTGTTNLDKNSLPEGYNVFVEQIGLKWGYDNTASVTNPALIRYYNYVDVPQAIVNGEISVRIGERLVLNRMPIAELFASNPGSSQSDIGPGNVMIDIRKDDALWKSGEQIVVTFHSPPGSTLPTGNHFIEFKISGMGTRPRM